MEWIWFWLLFVIVLLLLPLGYGWGYRGWGPPPAPYRRGARAPGAVRRDEEIVAREEAEEEAEEATWGVIGFLVWFAFFVALLWLVAALVVA